MNRYTHVFFFFQAEDGIRDSSVTGVQTCALPICYRAARRAGAHPLPLRKYALMDRASRRAGGLTDFGDPRFEEGLDHLIDSIDKEDRLNGVGRILAASHIPNLLRQRLLVTEHLLRHPEIRDEVIE